MAEGDKRDEGDRAGNGMPSQKLHWIIGSIALAAAIGIAITGVGTHGGGGGGSHKPGPAKASRANPFQPVPRSSTLQQLLKKQRAEALVKEKKRSSGGGVARGAPKKPGRGGGSGFGVPSGLSAFAAPNRRAIAAKNGQIAASQILAMGNRGASSPTRGREEGGAASLGLAPPLQPVRNVGGKGLLKGLAALEHAAQNPARRLSMASRQERWLRAHAGSASGYGAISHVLAKLPGSLLYPGTSIPATTLTRIDTQSPGLVVAQVTRNVYASDGREVIPQGARVMGQYDSQIFDGQYRVMMAFNRMVFPDGREVVLGGAQGVGPAGAAGVTGNAHTHFWKALGASLMVAFMDEGVSAVGPKTQVQYPGSGASMSTPAQTGAQIFANQAQRILEPYTSIRPTITVPSGKAIRIMVRRTIQLPD
ncbi:type IV secretion system protein virB10 [bacterium BMS3Bbin13]|nr:type IV secretion system protein virB10 [bacterium BMS3Bbin13]